MAATPFFVQQVVLRIPGVTAGGCGLLSWVPAPFGLFCTTVLEVVIVRAAWSVRIVATWGGRLVTDVFVQVEGSSRS